MIRTLLRSALLLALVAPAMTQLTTPAMAQSERPALRATVTVASDVVRIGDLVENAGPVADIPVFRAPDLGTTGAVEVQSVVDAIRPHQLIDIDTRGLSEVIVTRASRTISPQEISARVAAVMSGHYGLGAADDILVNFDHEVPALQVEPAATGALQLVGLAYDSRSGRFDVTFDLPSSPILHSRPLRLTGTAIETINTVAVDHPVERGEVLKASDLAVLRRPKVEGGALTDMAAVIGLAARHQLRPGQPLYAADVMKPDVVQRNDTVTIVYEAPGLTLTLRGQAQEPGALGDSIGVLNLESKRIVQGIVAGPGRVTVRAVTTRLVSNAAAPAADSPTAMAVTAE